MLTPDALGLSWRQRVKLRFSGYVYLEHRKKPTWKGTLPHYLAKCKIHGYYIDYPHGFDNVIQCTTPGCKEAKYVSP